MDTAIIVALISLTSAVGVCLINNFFSNRTMQRAHERNIMEVSAQNQQAMALIEYKLGELSKNVEKHNNVIERTYHLEEKMSVVEEKIKVVNNRIADLEDKK